MKIKHLNHNIEQIIEAYKQQYRYYEQLKEISAGLGRVPGDPALFEELALQGRDILARINETEQTLSDLKEQVMHTLHLKGFNLEKADGLIHHELLQELNRVKAAVTDIVKSLVEIELKNETVLADQIRSLDAQIRKNKEIL